MNGGFTKTSLTGRNVLNETSAACLLGRVEQVLAPTLKPGDIVVLDNLDSHKGGPVRKAIRACRGEEHLPTALQSRSQSDRTGLRQAQDFAAKSRGAIR